MTSAMLTQVITVLVDIGLGFMAYRLARENKARTEVLETRQADHTARISKLETQLES